MPPSDGGLPASARPIDTAAASRDTKRSWVSSMGTQKLTGRIRETQSNMWLCCQSFLRPCCSIQPGGDCECLARRPSRACCLNLVDGRVFTVVITIMTLYALFGDDMRLWLTTKTSDDVFFGLSAVAFVFFLFELIINSISRPRFANPPSFFFWLDLLATLSLLPDIGWVWDPIEDLLSGTSDSGTGSDISSQIRAGRAARAGTRAGRVVRVVRLIRLVRVFKLYKQWARAREIRRAARERAAEEERQRALEEAHRQQLAASMAASMAERSGSPDAASPKTEAAASSWPAGRQSRKVMPINDSSGGGTPLVSSNTDIGARDPGTRRSTVLQPSAGSGVTSPSHGGEEDESPAAASAGKGDDASDHHDRPASREGAAGAWPEGEGSDDGYVDGGKLAPFSYGYGQTALDAAILEQEEEAVADPSPRSADGTHTSAKTRRKISNVGIVLSDLTTRRVIVLILVMLIIVPFLAATPTTAATQIRGGLAELHRYPQDVNVTPAVFRFSVEEYGRYAGKVVFLAVCPPESTGCRFTWTADTLHSWLQTLRFDENGDQPRLTNGTADDGAGSAANPINGWTADLLLSSESDVLSKYRNVEVQAHTVATCYGTDALGRAANDPNRGDCLSVVWTDETTTSKDEAFWSFIRTWFVIAVITVGAGMFTRDAELLVIRPIERMTLLMSKLAADPLAEIQALKKMVLQEAYDSDEEYDTEEEYEEEQEADKDKHGRRRGSGEEHGPSSSDDTEDSDGYTGVADDDHKQKAAPELAKQRPGVIPKLPTATIMPAAQTTHSNRRRSNSTASSGRRADPSSDTHLHQARRHSHRARSSGRRGPALSQLASKRFIMADANPVLTSAPMLSLTSGGSKTSARRIALSKRRIASTRKNVAKEAASAEAESTVPVSARAGGDSKTTTTAAGTKEEHPSTIVESTASGSSKKRSARKPKAKPLTARSCVKSTASYMCTSLLNLAGGSAEDASRHAQGSYETAQLENAMLKIGALLQLGFGEAGADIIGQNMGQSKGRLNPLVPGRRIDAIFGFCDIRRFTDATECLQEEVMVFVNTIGQLVHSCTHRLGGAANKNIGDAFLLTWKLPKLLDPREARIKRRALIHKARGMHARNRRVSMEAFASMLDSPAVGPDSIASVHSARGFHGAERSSLGASMGEWVAEGEFTSGASRVPFGGRKRSVNSSNGDAVAGSSALAGDSGVSEKPSGAEPGPEPGPGADSATRPPVQFKLTSSQLGREEEEPGDVQGIETVNVQRDLTDEDREDEVALASASAGGSSETTPLTAGHAKASSAGTGSPERVMAVVRGKGGAAWGAGGGGGGGGGGDDDDDDAGKGGTSASSSASSARADTFKASGRAISHGHLLPPPRISANGDGGSGGGGGGGGGGGEDDDGRATTGTTSSATARRRASSPSGVVRRKRMTRPSIVSVLPGKEHQYEAGVTIIHDPTASPAAGGSGLQGPGAGMLSPTGSGGMRAAPQLRDRKATARVTDNALAAFLKVVVDIHNANKRRGALYRFRRHPAIRKAFGKAFKVKLGFGLHLGWAVEGAVGSSYKVDASYLSPHVNLASRLEALTKAYGVPLLLSGNFAQELSLDAQRYLRLVDRVTVKGSKTPIELYTFDIQHYPETFGVLDENLEPTTEEQREANAISQEAAINIDFASDPNILRLQEGLPDAFFVDFHMGVRAYIRGQWPEARRVLIETRDRYRPDGDGPTDALLRTMDKLGVGSDGEAPPTWKGVNVLDSKSG